MFKRKSLKSIDRFDRAGYVIYQNNKIVIIKYYNESGRQNYLRDIGQCLWMFVYGIISIIAFPFCLVYTLLNFIPRVYIKDESIDIKEKKEKDIADREIDNLIKENN